MTSFRTPTPFLFLNKKIYFPPIDNSPQIVTLDTADSSTLVRFGKTKLLCGISGQLTVPNAATPNEGMFSINVEFSPVSSPGAKSGAPTEAAQSLAIFLDNILKQVIEPSQICIVEDRLAWALFIDIYCLEGKV